MNYMQPGKPQPNVYVKRFDRTARYEWLSQYYRDDLAHVQQFATEWMRQYNHERPSVATRTTGMRHHLFPPVSFAWALPTSVLHVGAFMHELQALTNICGAPHKQATFSLSHEGSHDGPRRSLAYPLHCSNDEFS
nr:integrase core domain-containing protein [Caballeronia sp. GAFFF2]